MTYATPLLPVKSGLPLIRSTPNLGWQAVRIRGRVDVGKSLKMEAKKKRIYWGFKRFVEWMEKEGHRYRGKLRITGPFPHADLKEPNTQVGDRGGAA